MPPDAIEAKVQRLDLGTRVELFDIDMSPVGSSDVLSYTPMSDEIATLGKLEFGGVEYLPMPIAIEGISVSGKGALPRPILTLSNILGEFNTLETVYGSVEGAILTRTITYAEYLDNGSAPDPNAHLVPDIFIINRVAERDDVQARLELRTIIDVGEKKVPARPMLRNACTHIYRVWTGSSFSYAKATCPYTGTAYFDANDQSTTAGNDKCSKKLSGCRARFGTQPLPTRAFPASGRYK